MNTHEGGLMETLKNVGWTLLGTAIMVAVVFVATLLINGMAWVSGHVLEYLITFNNIVTAVCIVFLLPLAPFRETRIVPAYGLYVASFVFGVCVWVYGFAVTYEIWGGVGVFIGLILGIVGIVPLGIIAALSHAEWVVVAELIYGLVLTYGARAIALWLAAKIEADANGTEYVQEASAVGSQRLKFAVKGWRADSTGVMDQGPASRELPPSSKSSSLNAGSNDQVWQTFVEHEPSISEAVERLSSLSQRNVGEFRTLFLQHRDCSRVKEFEEEAIRRIQGPAFVNDATLREAYLELNHEDGRLGEELVRVVGVIGKPRDLERTIAQVRKKFLTKEKDEQERPAHAEAAAPLSQGLPQTSEVTETISHTHSIPQIEPPVSFSKSTRTATAWVLLLLTLVLTIGILYFAFENRLQESKSFPVLKGPEEIEAQLEFYRLTSGLAAIVEGHKRWWWEGDRKEPGDFRMHISNPAGTSISGLLLKIHEGQCSPLKSEPNIVWNYFVLQFSFPLGVGHARLVRADMPRFTGCAIVVALYAQKRWW